MTISGSVWDPTEQAEKQCSLRRYLYLGYILPHAYSASNRPATLVPDAKELCRLM